MLPIRSVMPFDRVFGLRQEMDRLFDRFYGDTWGGFDTDRTWTFPLDLVETPEDYRYTFEVPGFSREDLDVTVENGVLTVTAERPVPTGETENGGEWRHRHLERRCGRFVRSFSLPANAILDDVEATCENRILTVRVPKSQHARPRRIEIGSETGQRQIAGQPA